MNGFLLWLVEANAFWLTGYVVYCLLAGDTFFRLRRAVLLGLSVAALLLPLFSGWSRATMAGEAPFVAVPHWLPTVVVGVRRASAIGWTHVLPYVYVAVSALLLLRTVVQLVLTLRFIRRQPVCEAPDGTLYRLLPPGTSPFSFFRWLLLSKESVVSPHFAVIVCHERVHMRCGHSFDILWMRLQQALLWMNPCVWLALRELRRLHDYETDCEVTRLTASRQDYQMALLTTQTRHSVATNLCNNFNVSPLKERILMMNKTRTRRSAALKYALLIPAAALTLMCGGTLRAAATGTLSSVTGPQVVAKKAPAKATPSTVRRVAYKSPQKAKANGTVRPRKGDVQPQYPGGNAAMMRFIAENVRYPKAALDAKAEGFITVFFTVTAKGKACNFKTGDPQVSNHGMNEEALRVVSLLKDKKFTPGRQNGKPVDMQMAVPVRFKLQ